MPNKRLSEQERNMRQNPIVWAAYLLGKQEAYLQRKLAEAKEDATYGCASGYEQQYAQMASLSVNSARDEISENEKLVGQIPKMTKKTATAIIREYFRSR
jgi:hypothetical protein